MSLSPTQNTPDDDYKNAWLEINRLISQGKSWSGNEANCMFVNKGDGSFGDASAISGLNHKDDGRSAVAHDFDYDGDLDILITNRTTPRLRVMRNDLDSTNKSLKIKLHGYPNPDAIGARVEIGFAEAHANRLVQTRRAGSGYQAQSSAWMHFGMAGNTPRELVVKWANGKVNSFNLSGLDFSSNNTMRLSVSQQEQNFQISNAPQLQLPPITADSDAIEDTSKIPFARIVLPHPIPMPTLSALMPDGREVTMFGAGRTAALATPQSRATLLNLWSETCAPCISELNEIDAHQQQFVKAAVVPIALNVESNKTPPGFTAPAAQATAHTIKVLDLIQRTVMLRDIAMPTPSSFLIDARGNLVAIYLGALNIDALIEDFGLLNMSDEQRMLAAVPFAGRWFDKQPQPSLLPFEYAFTNNEMLETAREFQVGFIYIQMARAFSEGKRHQSALEYFNLAAEEGPYFFEAFSGRGFTKQVLGDYAGAIADYNSALALKPNDPAVLYNLEQAKQALKN
ncbi:MAG: ASPIC/UnbV domain-containing protein [Planctomycetota bacterium]|nr:ASPIC/UnbV domain-containing protein [Planctomycetota bacterium]